MYNRRFMIMTMVIAFASLAIIGPPIARGDVGDEIVGGIKAIHDRIINPPPTLEEVLHPPKPSPSPSPTTSGSRSSHAVASRGSAELPARSMTFLNPVPDNDPDQPDNPYGPDGPELHNRALNAMRQNASGDVLRSKFRENQKNQMIRSTPSGVNFERSMGWDLSRNDFDRAIISIPLGQMHQW